MHGGPEVEIEDDTVRLRRRKREYEADAARPTGPDRLRTAVAGTAKQAVSKRMALGSMFSLLMRGLRRGAALLRTRRPPSDRPASIPRIRWYS
jgi:hypothetical protein